MNKIVLVMLVFVCALVCTMWSVNASAKSSVHKKVSAKKDPTKTKSAVKTKINPKDGAEIILIPAGEFLMGTSEEELAALLKTHPEYKSKWFANEMPQRKVELDAYYMYKTEVTVAQYKKFCKATKRKMPREPSWKWQDTHPIVNVSWKDAKAYADWAGAVLPTEAQWEKAARGTDSRLYPWGDVWDAKKCSNWEGDDNNSMKTLPVGSFPLGASPYGMMDMTGNVWEWCYDWYNKDYYKTAPSKNPFGPKIGDDHVIRGSAWNNYYYYNDSVIGRCAFRCGYSINDDDNVGFRCAVSLPKKK